MKKVYLPILLLHITMMVNAATYYFSSTSGNDSRTATQAQNSSTPWQTISKLNSIMSILQPGDQVLFKSGDTFTGGITVTVSGTSSQPIIFGSYGSGSKPVISGFTTLSGWSQARNYVWEAPLTVASTKEGMVIMNNQQQGIGRYPNTNAANGGYLNINSNNGSTQLASSQLPSSPNWTGADVVIRKNRWTLDRSTISSHSGTTLNFASGSYNPITNNFGFFIVNSTNTLDQNGEWFYDNSRSKLQMYFANNNPGAYTVQASTVETLVTISFQNYITFNNLAFIGANSYAFNLTNANNINLNSCFINFTGIDGLQALSSNYIRVENSKITNTNNDAISCYWNCNSLVVSHDTVTNSGLIAGMGQNGNTSYEGVYMNGSNNLVQYCEVDSSGYDGIHFEGDYAVVRNSYVNTFGFVLDDAGGIYTGQGTSQNAVYNSRSVIFNTILNGIGAGYGTDDSTINSTQGVYLDDNTNHTLVYSNTVSNCAIGVFNHNSYFTCISNNTLYNNSKEQFLYVRQITPISNVTVQNNIMFAKTVTQLVNRMETYTGNNDLSQIGSENNNYYCRPVDTSYMFYDMYAVGTSGTYVTSYETLSTWQSKFGLDATSHSTPGAIPSFVATNPSGVNLFPNGSFSSNANNVGVWSPIGNGTVSWLPNQLTGGTVQLSSTNYSATNGFYTTLNTSSSVTAGQGYLLSFTVQGAVAGSSMNVYLRQGSAPYGAMSTSTKVPVPTTAQNVQLAFTPTVSGPVFIEMDIVSPTGAVLLDNVVLQQATITQTNPDDYIVFQYNPGSTTKSFILNGSYMDAKGATYSGTVTLQPYTSLVLFKQTTQSVAQTSKTSQSISLQGNLVNASAASIINSSATTKLTWKVDNQNSTASYYEVERSTDAQNFITLGKASVKTEGASTIYQYEDASPLAGKNYYRVTQHNGNGDVVISKTIVVNNISFKVNPNPAKDVIHVSFDEIITANDNMDKEMRIINAAGVTVQTVRLTSTDNLSRTDINVSSLLKGVYMLSISSQGQTFSKAFIKQ